jgi:hypothetical protein
MSGPLAVAVVLDGRRVPRWIESILADLDEARFVEPLLFVLGDADRRPRGSLLFRLYERLDHRLFATPDDPLCEVDASSRLEGREVLRRGDLSALRARRPDVVLHLGAGPPAPELRGVARHGLWSYELGDPPLFGELRRDEPVTTTALRVDPPDGPALSIQRSLAATDAASLQRNREQTLWKSSAFALRALRDLHERGWPALAEGARPAAPPAAARAGSWAALGQMVKSGARVARERLADRLTKPQWFVGVRRLHGSALAEPTVGSYAPVPQPDDRFYADPFPAAGRQGAFLFFEDYSYATDRGVISYVALDDEGRPASTPRTALERDYHLSYPFVFSWRGEIWMLPETRANRTVELYRATAFPDAWTREAVLFEDVHAVDATLLERAGRFWLFVNMSLRGANIQDELYLYHAASPLGPWTAHPANPVVSDVTRARPAGTIFRSGDDWIRPAQDCSLTHGGALALHRIEALSETEYREVPVRRIEPGWVPGAIGTHTLSRGAGYEAIDWKLRTRR